MPVCVVYADNCFIVCMHVYELRQCRLNLMKMSINEQLHVMNLILDCAIINMFVIKVIVNVIMLIGWGVMYQQNMQWIGFHILTHTHTCIKCDDIYTNIGSSIMYQ